MSLVEKARGKGKAMRNSMEESEKQLENLVKELKENKQPKSIQKVDDIRNIEWGGSS